MGWNWCTEARHLHCTFLGAKLLLHSTRGIP